MGLLLAVLMLCVSWLSMDGSFHAEERDVTPHTDVVISYVCNTHDIFILLFRSEQMVPLAASLSGSE